MTSSPDANPESDRFDDAPHPRETLCFFGNREAERELLDAYRENRLAQAFIISGPEGVGKATLAWRMARFLLAHPDPNAPEAQSAASLEVPADAPASRRIAALALADVFLLRREWNEKTKKHFTEIRIDDVRKLIHLFHHGAGAGGWRIAIVDCADDLNRSSANALLKLIEEPPERSLFLIVAHQPGRLLPTIRSRCRQLALRPLSETDVASAVRALAPLWRRLPEESIAAAAAASEGSVREALRLLSGDGVAFDASLRAMLGALPRVDWLGVHSLSDRLAGRDNEASFDAFLRAVYRWLDARVREGAGRDARAARLSAYADAFAAIAGAARETETLNLDKKALVLSIFARLAEAERTAA